MNRHATPPTEPAAGGRPPAFRGRFTRQEPIPEEGALAALAVMRSGRLHRYDVDGEDRGQASALEAEYAAWQGAPFCLAVASGGQAIQIALRAAGVRPGDVVLTSAFTLAPVPGAVTAVGAVARLVETTEDLRLDLDDLAAKAPGARAVLVSHMRGHLSDVDAVRDVARAHGLVVVEDCAHAMGARWRGLRSGNLGDVACFSTQSYKHMNSGEGGLVTAADEALMARATVLSGSYALGARHGAGPRPERLEEALWEEPNCSARMDQLRAAILRPQIAGIDARVAAWNARHNAVAGVIGAHPAVRLPARPPQESPARSSIQFALPGWGPLCAEVAARAAEMGVALKWFGASRPAGYTSAHASWRHLAPQRLPRTDAVLSDLLDMRLPLAFSLADCAHVGAIVLRAADEVARR